MSNKIPSPWSGEFYTGSTIIKIGGDELEHGIIKNTYKKVKKKAYENKRQRQAIDAYRAAKTNGRWDLIPRDMRSLITQMSKNGTVIDKFGNTIKLPPITTSGSRWVDHTKGYETTTKKTNSSRNINDLQRKQREEEQKRKKVAAAKAAAKARRGGKDRM